MEVNVTWSGTLLNDGSGKIKLWALLTTTQTGSTTSNTVLPCDIQIPSFSPIIGNAGAIAFPTTLFDHSPPFLTVTGCNRISGNAVVASIDSHVLGCHVGGGFCNLTQATFVDGHRPVYKPVAGATQALFKAVKMTNAATCANVRATTFS
jgi:hypothetical protein